MAHLKIGTFSKFTPAPTGFSRASSAELERALLSWCNGKPVLPVVSHRFELSRTESTGFSYPDFCSEIRCCSAESNSSFGQGSPVGSECCSEAATIVGDGPCSPRGEPLSEAGSLKSDARLRSACRVFNISARRDGGCFDLHAALLGTAILRLSSGSVLFTRSTPASRFTSCLYIQVTGAGLLSLQVISS